MSWMDILSQRGPALVGDQVLSRNEGAISWITLNRPERLNALAGTMREDLLRAVEAAVERAATRVIVITGAGRAFCAGADLEAMEALLTAEDEAGFTALVQTGMRVVRALRRAPKPVIAALNGVAAGAGASLAAACDVRVAARDARIGFTFSRIGLHPDWGATYTLPRLVGVRRGTELVFSGRMLDSAEAHAIGLFDHLVAAEELTAAAHAEAERLAAGAPLALGAAKRSLDRGADTELDACLERELQAQLLCFRSRDVREGIAAFREKRTPVFEGR